MSLVLDMFCSHGKTFLVVAVIGHLNQTDFVLSLTPFWRRSCHSRSCHSCRRSWSYCSCRSFRSCWSFQVAFNLATRLHKTWKIATVLKGTCTCWTCWTLVHWSCLPAERRDDLDGFGRTWISWNPGDPEIQIYPAEQLNSTIPRNLYQRFGQMAPYSELKLGSTSSATP